MLAARPSAFPAVAIAWPLLVAVARRESPAPFVGPLEPLRALHVAAAVLAVTLPLVPLGVALGLGDWQPRALDAVALVGVATSALVEEWLFRGYLQARLTRLLPPRRTLLGAPLGAAWLLTALAFGLAHLGRLGPAGALARTAPGLAFGYCRARGGSLWPALLVHLVYNLVGASLSR